MRILHVIHDFLPRHRAGSEIYAFNLASSQADLGHETHILAAEYDSSRRHGELIWREFEGLPVTELINNWNFGSFEESYRSELIGETLEHVLRAIAPDVLHIHNLLNLSFELPNIAARRGIPSLATLHEFTLLCPSGGQRVHSAEGHICTAIDPKRCARCFPQSPFAMQMAAARFAPGLSTLATRLRRLAPARLTRMARKAASSVAPGVDAGEIKKRLDALQRVWDSIRLFVAPSPFLGRDFLRFGLPEEKLEISDYGFPPLAKARRHRDSSRLRIGFVGTLVRHKGAHILVEALRDLPPGSFELHLHGDLDTFPDYVAQLHSAAKGMPVTFHGGFTSDRRAEIYASLDVLVVCSVWPENSPLVIHEAFQSGVVVVGSAIGGTEDLIREDENGLLYEPNSPQDLARKLERLINEPGLLRRLAEAAPAVKSIEEDAAEWITRYHSCRAGELP